MLSESRIDLHKSSQIGADQKREGSSGKSWFGTANHLHCTPYPSWARFSGSRTNFIGARTTSRHGPSTGESLVQHGWVKVVYTTKSIRAEPIFLVRVLFSSEPCQNFSAVQMALKASVICYSMHITSIDRGDINRFVIHLPNVLASVLSIIFFAQNHTFVLFLGL